jgi:hypothetical protein
VIGDHVHWSSAAFQVLTSVFEGLKDHEKFLVVSVVVEFCRIKGVAMESDGVNFAVGGVNGEDGGGVAIDEPAVEVGEAKEGLNVLDLPRTQTSRRLPKMSFMKH